MNVYIFLVIFMILFAKIMFWVAIANERMKHRQKIKLDRLKKKGEAAIKATSCHNDFSLDLELKKIKKSLH